MEAGRGVGRSSNLVNVGPCDPALERVVQGPVVPTAIQSQEQLLGVGLAALQRGLHETDRSLFHFPVIYHLPAPPHGPRNRHGPGTCHSLAWCYRHGLTEYTLVGRHRPGGMKSVVRKEEGITSNTGASGEMSSN